MNWYACPFLRLLLPFMAGIWFAYAVTTGVSLSLTFYFAVVWAILVVLFVLVRFLRNTLCSWVFGVVLNVFLFVFGVTVVEVSSPRNDGSFFGRLLGRSSYFCARLVEEPTVKARSIKAEVEVIGCRDSVDIWHGTSGRAVVYFAKDSVDTFDLSYGSLILFSTNLETIGAPANPEQFDYQRYMSRKGILYSVYLPVGSWSALGERETNGIFLMAYRLRDYLLATMRELGIEGGDYAVAAAILLGYDDELPQELRQSYVTAGAMHILCVSGLHVGVVYLLFNALLSFLNGRSRRKRVIKNALLLLLIWFYAFLAGLAPSILRATIMLSFIIVGSLLQRSGRTINSICASAFLLLVCDPGVLFNMGFQLSYAGVVGIVMLQRSISSLFVSRWRIINWIWELTAVTISAQLATMPFTLLYFNQFPTYFWLSNLFMSPLSSVVITGGMAMLMVSFVPFVNFAVAWCVDKMIFLMNYLVEFVEELPLSMIKGLYINELQFVALLMAFIFIILLVRFRRKKFFYGVLVSLMLFFLGRCFLEVERSHDDGFVVYNVRSHDCIAFFVGDKSFVVSDSALVDDVGAFDFSVRGDFTRRGVREVVFVGLDEDFEVSGLFLKRGPLISFGGDLMFLYDGSYAQRRELAVKIAADFVVPVKKGRYSIDEMRGFFVENTVFVDVSEKFFEKS